MKDLKKWIKKMKQSMAKRFDQLDHLLTEIKPKKNEQ
jgi:hypothetical protein